MSRRRRPEDARGMRGAACTASRVAVPPPPSRNGLWDANGRSAMSRTSAMNRRRVRRSRAMGSPPHVPTSRGRTGPRGAHDRHGLEDPAAWGIAWRTAPLRASRFGLLESEADVGEPVRDRLGAFLRGLRSAARSRTPALLPRERGSRAGGRPPSRIGDGAQKRRRRLQPSAHLDGPSGIGNALLIGTYARLVDRAIATE